MVTTHISEDPYLWLEGVEDEKALNWVREQNKESLTRLEQDQRFLGFKAVAEELDKQNGIEATFFTNHVGHFMLVTGLLLLQKPSG